MYTFLACCLLCILDAAETTISPAKNVSVKFTQYHKEVHGGNVITIRIPGAKMNDETYEKLRRFILRKLNERARRRRLQTTATTQTTVAEETGTEATATTEETAAVEGSGEIEAFEDVGSGEVGVTDGLSESDVTQTGARRRRRQAAGDETTTADDLGPYTADDIEFIENAEDGSFSIVVRNKEDGTGDQYLSADELAELLDEHKDEMEEEMGHPVQIEPLPPKAERVDEEPVPQAKRSVWDAHFGLFLTIIVLLAICIIVTIICCICLRCRAREDSEKTPMALEECKVEPLTMSNPVDDAEIVRDEAPPMLERANPALPANGGGQHLNKHEDDDGWVVPLDELTGLDRNLPDVENTRL